MAFHVPFNQRNRNQSGPVYIGFDEPARFRRSKFNWWGFNGLWMSLAAFFSAGFLSLISLLVSLRGLKKKPRGMAIAGTIFSLAGICIASFITVSFVSHEMHREHNRQQAREHRAAVRLLAKCEPVLQAATSEFETYRDNHDGELPSWINGNMLAIKHLDPWQTSLRFEPETDDFALLRSAGPDKEFDTSDDIVKRVEGKTEGKDVLLPLD